MRGLAEEGPSRSLFVSSVAAPRRHHSHRHPRSSSRRVSPAAAPSSTVSPCHRPRRPPSTTPCVHIIIIVTAAAAITATAVCLRTHTTFRLGSRSYLFSSVGTRHKMAASPRTLSLLLLSLLLLSSLFPKGIGESRSSRFPYSVFACPRIFFYRLRFTFVRPPVPCHTPTKTGCFSDSLFHDKTVFLFFARNRRR